MNAYMFPEFDREYIVGFKAFAGPDVFVGRQSDDTLEAGAYLIPMIVVFDEAKMTPDFLDWLRDEIHDGNAFEMLPVAMPVK